MAYTSTLKIEAVRSFEISVKFYHSTRPYIPEDSIPPISNLIKISSAVLELFYVNILL
jgi:hypothetical protein